MNRFHKRLAALEVPPITPAGLEQDLYFFCFADWLCVPVPDEQRNAHGKPEPPDLDGVLQVSFEYRKARGETNTTTIEAFRKEMVSIMPGSGLEISRNIFSRHGERFADVTKA